LIASKTLTLVFGILVIVHGFAFSQGADETGPRGLRLKCQGASPGYTLFTPLSSTTTYLVDLDGKVVWTWSSDYLPSAWVYLLDNGHVLRGGSDPGTSIFRGGGQGGRFQEFDFDGNLVWDFRFNEGRLPHHDVAILPNGNVLAIVWEAKTAQEARRVGRRSEFVPPNGIWPDMLIEFEPQRPNGARIVWEWHMWDHLVQNVDSTLENYDDPARRPERIDINADTVGLSFPTRDVFHTNSVAYNPKLDQIMLSVPTFNEVWVIDHSTTTQDAAGSRGGRSGKGGDLLYRWGNPQAYGRGAPADRLLGFQHDASWIPQGLPGAGHAMVFSNRTPGEGGAYSKVYEFVPPVDVEGRYAISPTGPFGPAQPVWTYSDPATLQAINVSGAQRLPNNNTLISSGPQGRLFEVTSGGDIVWEYWSPYGGIGPNAFILFRGLKIPPDHPGLAGRNLRPLDPQPPASATVSASTEQNCPAVGVPGPTLTGIQPSSAAQGSSVKVTLTGTQFVSPSVAVSGQGIVVSDVQAISTGSVTATFTIASGAPLGVRDVTLITAGGATNAQAFTVLSPQPTLTGIVPRIGARGAGRPLEVTLTGTNFLAGLALQAGAGITVSDVVVIDSTTATAKLVVDATASLGPRGATVTTSGGTSGPVTFIVANPFPDLSVASSHTGTFAAGFDQTYTITITNEGGTPTTRAISVMDLLPPGLAFITGVGPDWSCSASGQTVTCTHSTALAAGESTRYALTLSVSGDVASRLKHTVAVTVDGDLNETNNSATDVTDVLIPAPFFVFEPYPLSPGHQASIAVTMATPFPREVTGEITLNFISNAAIPVDDPAIQFSTGGRTVTFTIPANSTEARFASASDPRPLAFQTGTVAGTLKFSGSFTAGTVEGAVSLPPGKDAPAIPLQAPTIQSIQTSAESGFEVSILLFSTSREVTQLNLSFDTVPKVQLSCGALAGCSVSGNTLTLDVTPMFTGWFNADTAFGGLAQLRLPFGIEGGTVTGTVAVSLRNRQGVSNSVSFALPKMGVVSQNRRPI
jgi:uncharacterized repeat protein (TIGR01451 family)